MFLATDVRVSSKRAHRLTPIENKINPCISLHILGTTHPNIHVYELLITPSALVVCVY
jgi:hypothetical protein